MNIKKLTIENINCLVGKWVIDFENSDFAGQKFFAIIGNVGSGKSTILDSICLALYGQTPRCDSGQQIGNLVNANQKSGRVEIIFEMEGHNYCSSWSCTKNKSLKTEMNFYEIAPDGEKIEIRSGLRNVISKNVQILGMEFTQFTQSILLAQGEFRKFFVADTDKKAELLSKITGTDLYQQLPALAADKKREIEKELDNLSNNSACEGLLDESVAQEKRCEKVACEKQRAEIKSELDEIDSQIKLFTFCAEAEEHFSQADHKLTEALERREAWASEAAKLSDGERAQTAEKMHIQYCTKKNVCQKIERQCVDLKEQVEQIDKDCLEAKQNYTHCQVGKERWLEIYEGAESIFELEKGKIQQLDSLRQTWKQKDQEITNLKNELKNNRVQVEAKLKEAASIKESLQQTVQKICRQIAQNYRQVGIVLQYDYTDLAEVFSNKAEQQNKVAELEAAIVSVLASRTRQEFAQLESSLAEQVSEWQKILEKTDSLSQEVGNLSQCLDICQAKTTNLQNKQVEQKELEAKLEEAREWHKKAIAKYEAVKEIDELSGYRLKLQAGQCCPLCGSLEHPYAGQIEKTLQEQLQKAEALSQESEREVVNLEQKLQEVINGEYKLQTEIASLQRDYNSAISKISQILTSLKGNVLSETDKVIFSSLDSAENCLRNLAIKEIVAAQLSKEVDSLSKAISACYMQAEQNNKKSAYAQNSHRELKQKLQNLDWQLNLSKRLLEVEEQFQEALNLAGVNISEVNVPLSEIQEDAAIKIDKADLGELLNQSFKDIASLKENCYRAQSQIEIAENLCSSLRQAIAEKEQSLEKLNQEIKLLKESGEVLATESEKSWQNLEYLWQQGAYYGESSKKLRQDGSKISSDLFSKAEKKFKERHEGWEKLVRDSQLKFVNLETKLHSMREQLQKAEAERQGAENDYVADKQVFYDKLRELGFVDENDWQTKYLTPEELSQLRRQKADLDTDVKSAEDGLAYARIKVEEAKEKVKNCRFSFEELQQRSNSLSVESDKISEQIGQLSEILQKHEKALSCAQELEPIRRQKEEEVHKWKVLTEVLGDQKGKKLNRFVQGLTFRLLLGRTNERLRNLTDRYELTIKTKDNAIKENTNDSESNKDVKNELNLEFSVIDKYQSTARDSRNLSGGESFLVSLAMALALSDLASQRRDINSLFLDEGFGTLDSETLGVVLRALTALGRQDKMIGVVSHVAEVSENIPAQLELKRNGDGTSKIIGHYIQVNEVCTAAKTPKRETKSLT